MLVIREVQDLNLGLETGFPDRVFVVFLNSCSQVQYARLVRSFTHPGVAYSRLLLHCSTRETVSARVFWSVATHITCDTKYASTVLTVFGSNFCPRVVAMERGLMKIQRMKREVMYVSERGGVE